MNHTYPDAVIQIFCKAPVPGTVKTRLMTAISAEQATELHKKLSYRTFKLVSDSGLCAMQIWCSPSAEHDFFSQAVQDFDCTLRAQEGDDLGERMHHAFCEGLKDYKHVLLVGCDCPSLTENDLQEAMSALSNQADAVIAPAEDGGYVLIGLNQSESSLFHDMQWGTSTVLAITRTRIQALKLSVHELAEQWDVDYPEDLERLGVVAKT